MAKKKNKRKGAAAQKKPSSGARFILQRAIGIVMLCFILVVLGFIGISFISGGYKTVQRPPAASAHSSGKQTAAQPPAPKPKYTFYDDLAKRNQEVQQELQRRIAQNDGVKVKGRNYRVQIGAFKDRAKADQLRAHMILREYPAQVVNNGDIFLVQLGPFLNREEAEKVQKRVRREGIKDSVLKAYVN